MLERTDELFQHRAVELGLPATDFQIGALVEFLRRRAQNPVQPFRHAAERHRPDREKLLLHVARQARLRNQRGVGVVQVLQERLLHRGNVVHAFRERARQLLEPRVAVEFERIEPFRGLAGEAHPRLDLRFALDFDFAHLRAEPDHAAGQLEQVRLQRTQFTLDPRPRDRNLARLVHEPVDHVGTNTQLGALPHLRLEGRRMRRLDLRLGHRR